ncbi:MAG: hypothetical protein H7A51_11565 [Akkermansiaceae bacterium]|nr:hypothetical protein [Akkermansiaceae bacterium]
MPAPSGRVDGKRGISLPADHAAHDEFAVEWWYYTGIIKDDAGADYAFHVAFFKSWAGKEKRFGIPVRWFGNPCQFAQAAVTDLSTGRRYVKEVIGSRRLGTAGATTDRLMVWTGKWVAFDRGAGQPCVRVDLGGVELDIELEPVKPWTLHGKPGMEPASRSYYMSSTRMSVKGTLKRNGSLSKITGTGWADHEMMGPDVARGADGWDWFALQLDDGSELVHYAPRHLDGSAPKRGMTVRIDQRGVRHVLKPGACRVEPTEHWTSPRSGVRFPVGWRLNIPPWGVDCNLAAAFKDGELYGRFSQIRYWEGLVRVAGRKNGRPLSGHGYVELTGYDRPLRNF